MSVMRSLLALTVASAILGFGHASHAVTIQTEVLADTPIGYWRLNETSGSTAADSSGNGRTATHQLSPTLGVPGIPGQQVGNLAASYNGTTQYSKTADLAVFTPPTFGANQGFSVELWVKFATAPSGDNDIAFSWYGTGSSTYSIYVLHSGADAGKAMGYVRDAAGNNPGLLKSDNALTTGAFHQLVLTFGRDAGNVSFQRFYVDGVLQTIFGATNLGAFTGTTYVGFGGHPLNFQYFGGTVDEVSVYNKALSPARIQAHYIAGITAIPEPSSVILLASGAMGFALWSRRRNRK